MTTTPPSAPRIVAATCGAAALIAIFVACAMPAPDVVAGPTKPEFVTANKQMSEFEVEAPARPVATTMPPEYPAELRAAGVGGVVVAKFVVDTNGRPDMATFLIVKSDHSLFGEAVREAMPEMEFVSAEVGGRRVRQLMQMPFIFSLSREDQTALMDSLGIKRPGPTEAARATPTPVSHPRRIAYPTTDPATAQPTFVRELTRFGRPARAAPRSLPPVPVRTIYRQGDTIAARALPTNAPPAYPAELRAAGIEGEVTASFVVRSDGRVDLNSFETVKSNHPLFSKAVKSAVPQMEFRPATVNGTAVDWVVTMPFVFSLAK